MRGHGREPYWLPLRRSVNPRSHGYWREGGKRLRGAIVPSTYKDLGDGDAMATSRWIEMIQAYSLVHTTYLYDDAECAGGRPACQRSSERAMGVLAGDAY